MRVLVTGAAGFIGSHLCQRLIAEGYSVVGVDNFDPFYEPAVKRRNLADLLKSNRFELKEGDIRDAAFLEAAADGSDAVVHLAAKAGVRPSIEDPLGYADVNVRGTAAVLESARKNKIRTVLFASSSSVYGNSSRIPFSEDDPVNEPVSPYAATKKAGEMLCRTYHHLYGMHIFCLRFFTVYGPRQRPDLAIHKFARLIEAGRPVPIYGDGSAERDFTYIDDIIDGTVSALKACRGFAVYNLGDSCPVRLDDLVSALEEALNKRAERRFLPPQPGDVIRTCADIRKAAEDLGYCPKTSLKEGLARFVQWMRREAV
ncbi:MAG TPA: GDP-mannose 4,6-dehydratase [Anaerohalosphaeraceae bacterium]|nr:GDP-mannose 4,6-dehydratase [Anaerohalosphaeraceae bacterium]HOL90034.1 GDP-mannose 4,6-dehydratase [Anaerohalosphaeraceae bacterium]HPP57373.1 GDP-mannose 4,6-dehydratase [Anaerohalosphaeraceae bacterium]